MGEAQARHSNLKPAPPRPDKAAFQAFAGAFFLLAALPCAYLAFGSYQGRSRHLALVEHFREHPELAPETSTPDRMVALNQSLAARDWHMALILGLASVVFLLLAVRLFVLATQNKGRQPHYAPIDWQMIPKPSRHMEMRYMRIYEVQYVLLVVFLATLQMLVFFSNGIKFTSIAANLGNTFIMGVVTFLMLRARRKVVHLFDSSGVTRGDNRHFDWDEFRGVKTWMDVNMLSRRRYIWRVELVFEGGETAWVLPYRVHNHNEVLEYLATLPRAINT